MIESPHSHAQYLVYRIYKFLGVKLANFKDCTIFPVNFLQYNEGKMVEKLAESDADLSARFNKELNAYVGKLSSLKFSVSSQVR